MSRLAACGADRRGAGRRRRRSRRARGRRRPPSRWSKPASPTCARRSSRAASRRARSCSSRSIASRATRAGSTPPSPSIRARSRRPTRAIASGGAGKVRGPLHGIPIALKDNIHTTDMPTTGGALAFARLVPPVRGHAHHAAARRRRGHHRQDGADRARQLGGERHADQLQLARAGSASTPTTRGRIPRPGSDGRPVLPTGGSSSGIGTAASFWAANVGTETSGSILNPASRTMLVGIKPTVGRISRYGVIPITADQDTPGPMARSVADAAMLLGVARGRRTRSARPGHARVHAAAAPRLHGVPARRARSKGARIGVPRAFFYEPVQMPGTRGAARGPEQRGAPAMTDAIAALRAAGATIVDPADLPSVLAPAAREPGRAGRCAAGPATRRGATTTAPSSSSTA